MLEINLIFAEEVAEKPSFNVNLHFNFPKK